MVSRLCVWLDLECLVVPNALIDVSNAKSDDPSGSSVSPRYRRPPPVYIVQLYIVALLSLWLTNFYVFNSILNEPIDQFSVGFFNSLSVVVYRPPSVLFILLSLYLSIVLPAPRN